MSTPLKSVASTGADRVFDSAGKVRIPGPAIPAGHVDEAKKPEAKKPEAKIPTFVHVTSEHIIKTMAKSSAQNRITRLVNLARVNQDVAWLLSEFKKADKPAKKSPPAETKKP